MKQIKISKIVAFDLDGTLLDSANDLINSLNLLLQEQRQKTMSKNKINHLVGNGALAMIKEAYKLNKRKKEGIDWETLRLRFLEIYKEEFLNESTLFPYTKRTLQNLYKNNIKMVIVSNKPQFFVKKILKHFDINQYFSAVSGGDTFKYRKPDPRHLIKTIEKIKVNKYKCCFIGDSINDALCAQNADVKLILLRHGYSLKSVDIMGADIVLPDLKDLESKIYDLI